MDFVTVDGLTLPLEASPDGIRIGDPGPPLEVIAGFVNAALSGWIPALREKFERGEDAIREPIVAMRVSPDDVGEAVERWRSATGTEPGEDIYLVGNGFAPNLAVPRTVLIELLERLGQLQLDHGGSPPGPDAASLFSEDPEGAPDPGPGARTYLEELEHRAEALDAIAGSAPSSERGAESHAQRRVLLASLDASGLLSDEMFEDKRLWLETWGLGNLLAYLESARQLIAYMRSAERRERLPEAEPQPVLGAPISVDWFRLGSAAHEGLSPFEWLAYCEYVFRDKQLARGSEGEFRIRAGGPWYRFVWRKDDGVTPALVSVTRA
jgi:hypothetical protein